MTILKIIAFNFLILVAHKAACQKQLTGTWRFSKVSSKDSTIVDVKESDKLRVFLIKNANIDFSKLPTNLIDTLNRYINKELYLVETSFLNLKKDSTFEISENEILIPKAIPGIVTESIISGTWKYNIEKQILTFQTFTGFRFLYKIVSLENGLLLTGIIHAEDQQPKFITTFTRN
jgi:hypothetical protein